MIHLSIRPRTSPAKSLLAGLLALSLSASAGIVVAAPSEADPFGAAQAPAAIAASSLLATRGNAALTPGILAPTAPIVDTAGLGQHLETSTSVGVDMSSIIRPQVAAPAKVVVAISKPKVTAPKPRVTVTKKVMPSYHGTYHLWIPALGLSREIYDWGCNGGLIPNRVEYWGCVPKSNLYLLGHAWGVFAKIHDGYHSGALHVGLTAWYADKAGNVHKYRISWIRHVRNADYASWSKWAMAASSGHVITLQTCDGATSAYRILVRLVPA